jgi:hypothetical protein
MAEYWSNGSTKRRLLSAQDILPLEPQNERRCGGLGRWMELNIPAACSPIDRRIRDDDLPDTSASDLPRQSRGD